MGAVCYFVVAERPFSEAYRDVVKALQDNALLPIIFRCSTTVIFLLTFRGQTLLPIMKNVILDMMRAGVLDAAPATEDGGDAKLSVEGRAKIANGNLERIKIVNRLTAQRSPSAARHTTFITRRVVRKRRGTGVDW